MTRSGRVTRVVGSVALSVLAIAVPLLTSESSVAAATADPWAQRVLRDDCLSIVSDVRKTADLGDLPSLRILAQMYVRGCGVAQDERHAGKVYKTIVMQSPDDPMANGYLTLNGDGRPKDPDRAVAYFRDAVHRNDVFAAYELSQALWDTNDSSSQSEAHRWSLVASRAGDIRSRATVASDLVNGYGQTSLDRANGLEMLHEADRANDPAAATQLGLSYRDGVGVPVDMRQAQRYFERAVKLGNVYGGLFLATLYCDTKNVAAARADSVRLIEDAEARSYDRSRFQAGLGFVYMLGVGIAPDYGKAIALLEDGVAGGRVDAMDNLAYLKFHGLGKPADFVGGVRLLRKAAALGDGYAKDQLAQIHVDVEQTASIPDPATDYYYQQTVRQAAQPQNQLPYPGSPAWVNTHDGQ